MKFTVAPLLAAMLSVKNVSATAIPVDTSLNPLNPRQGNYWGADECLAVMGGNVIGGSTLWMLRNTWNNHFGGNFGGSLTVSPHSPCLIQTSHICSQVGEKRGVCCWGQCLWVDCRGQSRSWNGDPWGDALRRLTNVVGERSIGLCGAKINNDPYLILMSGQHDKVGYKGTTIGKHFGDTCRGNPPW